MKMSVTIPTMKNEEPSAITLTKGYDSRSINARFNHTVVFTGHGVSFSLNRAQLQAALDSFELSDGI